MKKLIATTELSEKAKQIRGDVLKSIAEAGSGHTGGSLGLADIFTCLYFNILNHNPEKPDWQDRDKVVLSIGHVAPLLYATLSHAGYFPREELKTLRKLGSRLQGHPGRDHGLPGLELSAGSLGQGLSVSVGMALAAKADCKEYRIYSIHGDGELQEGSIWEAAMSASHYNLNNITVIVDRNYCQIDGRTKDVMEIEPLADKWKSFGWEVMSIDGHNFDDIIAACNKAKLSADKPTAIIANTLMGKGVKSIQDDYKWHGKAPSKEQLDKFIEELNEL